MREERAETTNEDRDHLWEALISELGIQSEEITATRRGSLNAALAQLRSVGATPEEIRRRSTEHRARLDWMMLTEHSLVKYWPTLGQPAQNGNGHARGVYRNFSDAEYLDTRIGS